MKSEFKKLTYESKFDRTYACWCTNHNGMSKVKRSNRQLARIKLKRKLQKEVSNLKDI